MRKRIFLFAALIVALAVLVSSVLITVAGYNDFFRAIKQEVAAEASYVRLGVELGGAEYLAKLEPREGHRFTVVAPDGLVLFDSVSDPAKMDSHLNRSEVQSALQTGMGESTRYSNTLSEQTYYYALKLADGSVLRMASSVNSVYASYNDIFWLVALIAITVILLSAITASMVTKRIVRPINALDLDNLENNNIYDELVPLLSRIKEQRSEISHKMVELDQRRLEFSAITESMNEGFLILNGEGKVLSYNKSALRLLDAQLSNPMGAHMLALNRSAALRDATEAALGGSACERIVEMAGRPCHIIANPVTGEDGLRGAVLLLLDVTEKQEREQLRREFTSNVSHELKTPLTAISGYAEIMLSGLAKPEDSQEFLQSIYSETQRLIALVRDLMMISKLEDDVSPAKEPLEILSIASGVADRLGAKADQLGVSIAVEGERVVVEGIPSVLEEMLYNLLENAIKYNQRGGKAIVHINMQGSMGIVSVTDTGIGIPKAEQERIFERFYRVDKSRNQAIEGTGLGLAIVKHGAEMHGAKLDLRSGPSGSTFTLMFPRA